MPTLRFVHQYPEMWTTYVADSGAIPYILGGANLMCGGLTSKGGSMPIDLEEGSPVIVLAEGKETAIAVGFMKMSTQEVRDKNKGVAIEIAHFLGDGLWGAKTIS
jgi:PUA domain protein